MNIAWRFSGALFAALPFEPLLELRLGARVLPEATTNCACCAFASVSSFESGRGDGERRRASVLDGGGANEDEG